MNEKKEKVVVKENNFWKWLSIALIIAIIMFGFNMCNPFNKSFNDIKNSIKNTDKGNGQKDVPHDYEKNTDLEEYKAKGEDRISAYNTKMPSNRMKIIIPVSPRELAYRWHCSIDEIYANNPWLKPGKPSPGQPSQPIAPTDPIPPGETVDIPDSDTMNGVEKQVLDLTNKARQQNGLQPLKGNNSQLNKSATAKSQDMSKNNYFSHNSPTYGSPFDMMKTFGISYSYAAENIAQGQRTAQEVVDAWLNSPGHRANIMNRNLTEMGVGFEKGNNKYYWTQQFIGK